MIAYPAKIVYVYEKSQAVYEKSQADSLYSSSFSIATPFFLRSL